MFPSIAIHDFFAYTSRYFGTSPPTTSSPSLQSPSSTPSKFSKFAFSKSSSQTLTSSQTLPSPVSVDGHNNRFTSESPSNGQTPNVKQEVDLTTNQVDTQVSPSISSRRKKKLFEDDGDKNTEATGKKKRKKR